MATVYVLRDPRTQAMRYVGQTRRALALRLSGHLAKARAGDPWPVYDWMRELMAADLTPLVETLAEVPNGDARRIEREWIVRLRREGTPLLNMLAGGTGRSAAFRAKVGEASRSRWAEHHDAIVAAQNAGKGAAYRRKLSRAARARGADPQYCAAMGSAKRQFFAAHPEVLPEIAIRQATKLTPDDADVIRERLRLGETQSALAREYGVHPCHISRINTGKRWKYTAALAAH